MKFIFAITALMIAVLILNQLAIAIIEESSLYEKLILERGVLRKGLLEKFFLKQVEGLRILYEEHFLELVEKNPDPLDVRNQSIINYLIFILEPLCILILLIIALYLILMSGTPQGRAFSKSLLPGIIIAIFLIPLSSYILFLIFGTSQSLTSEILLLSPGDTSKVFTHAIDYLSKEYSKLNESSFLLSMPFIFSALLILFINLVVFVIRYLLLNFLVVISPLTLFLYLFIPTRELGKRLIELTFSLITVQIVVAITLVSIFGSILLLPSTISDDIKILIELASTLVLIAITIGSVMILRNYLPG